jgi:AbrB family looped-hinge helix DNA binding protein
MVASERYVSKVTAKGQVTIPVEIRRALGLEKGAYVVWEPTEDRVVMERAAVPPTEDFDALARRIAERFSEQGVTREDVEDAIRWAREET